MKNKTSAQLPTRPRLVPRGKGVEIVMVGRQKALIGDSYALLLASSWWRLIAVVALTYIIINIFFAFLYLAIGDGIDEARRGSFTDAFFFSVQTMATIGYGKMSPHGILANILVTVEALIGFSLIAVMTGLVFSKFSRPTSRVTFSEKAVISNHNGVPHLKLRLANERTNRIVNARVQLVMLKNETNKEGDTMRRFIDLKLTRSQVPMLRLTWTVMHKINEKSPLYGVSQEDLAREEIEIIVSLTGLDETMSQTIHTRYSYIADEIVCGGIFEDIIERKDGKLLIHYDKLNNLKSS